MSVGNSLYCNSGKYKLMVFCVFGFPGTATPAQRPMCASTVAFEIQFALGFSARGCLLFCPCSLITARPPQLTAAGYESISRRQVYNKKKRTR